MDVPPSPVAGSLHASENLLPPAGVSEPVAALQEALAIPLAPGLGEPCLVTPDGVASVVEPDRVEPDEVEPVEVQHKAGALSADLIATGEIAAGEVATGAIATGTVVPGAATLQLTATAALLLMTVIWGWSFTVVKDALREYGVISFLALRFVMAGLLLVPFCAARLPLATLRTGSGIGLVLVAAYLFQTFGLQQTSATNSGLITGLFVVFAPLANRLLFRVQVQRIFWGAAVLSMVGLYALTGADWQSLKRGDVLTLGGAACLGLHIALLDRVARRHDAMALSMTQLLSAGVVFALIWPVSGEPLVWPSGAVWFALLVTGLLATALGFFVQTFAQQRIPAIRTAVILMMEPLFATLFGVLLAGDRLTGVQVAGAVLMMTALFLAELYPLLRSRSRLEPARAIPE